MRAGWIPPLLALAWGFNWPVVKIILGTVPPFTLRWLGLGGGALLLLAAAALRGVSLKPAAASWPGIAVGGLLTMAAFNICTALAQLSTTTSRAAVLTYTMPLIAAGLAWWLLGERPTRRHGAAWSFGLIGIGVLAWPVLSGAGADVGADVGRGPWRGLVWPLLAALTWAAGTVAAKAWPPAGDRGVVTAWQLVVGAACGGIGAAVAGERWPAAWPMDVLAALAYHVLFSTALAYVLWFALLHRVSATVAALTTLAVPVVGVLAAMALVGDRPALVDWIGFACVLAGAALAALAPHAAPAALSKSTAAPPTRHQEPA